MKKHLSSALILLVIALLTVSLSADEPETGESEDTMHHPHFVFNGVPHVLPNLQMSWSTALGGGFLGVGLTELSPELRTHFGVPGDAGVMINKVAADSPAAIAGLQVGDIITMVGGDVIGSSRELVKRVRHIDEPRTLDIEYWRDGSLHQTSAAIEIRERKVVDLSELDLQGLEKLEELNLDLGPEIFEQVNRSLEGVFDSDAWKIHVKKLEDVDVEKIEKRMEELKERMEELEEKLEKKLAPGT